MSTALDAMAAAHARWLSPRLADWYPQRELARLARDAMHEEARLTGHRTFGANFRDHVGGVPVADPLAWANRWVDLGEGDWCVTGIRFRGMDVERPFVDLVATSLLPTVEAVHRIGAAVLPLYAPFSPRALRVCVPSPDDLVRAAREHDGFHQAEVDQYVVAGPVRELLSRPAAPGPAEVALAPLEGQAAAPLVAELYARTQRLEPRLPEWATPSGAQDLEVAARTGVLARAVIDGRTAAVVAMARESGHGMRGFVVEEIVVAPDFRGRRLGGAVMQQAVRALPAGDDDVLWGSIHPGNRASLRNALSLGREVVAGYVWLGPDGVPGMVA